MTSTTEIKLSPAMIAALKGAVIVGDVVHVADGTKAQTVKGLESRGLSDLNGELNANGVEAARQLGNDTTGKAVPEAETPKDEPLADWERELLEIGTEEEPRKAVDLDKPHVVPNRADKRKAKFGLKGALSRLIQRQRNRRVAKYGDTKFGEK